MRVIRTAHFRVEQANDSITDEEISFVWTHPDVTKPSRDHLGALVRTSTVADGSRVTVVASLTADVFTLITTWRNT